jgi:hypothetical protein
MPRCVQIGWEVNGGEVGMKSELVRMRIMLPGWLLRLADLLFLLYPAATSGKPDVQEGSCHQRLDPEI